MGTDIMVYPERLIGGRYEVIPDLEVFSWRYYGMFGFLADVRNDAGIPPLAGERGIPEDSPLYPEFGRGGRIDPLAASWLSTHELTEFDYDASFTGRLRIVQESADGRFTYLCDPDAATEMTFRRILGPDFFVDLAALASSDAERIVFFFF